MNSRTIAILAALAAAGCVPNDASVRLFALCFPPTPSESGGCSYPATCGSLLLGGLEFDVSSTASDGPLIWPIQVDNQRTSNADRSGGTETAIAWIEGYRISYTSAVVSIPDVDIGISRHPVNPGGSSVVIAPVVPRNVGTLLSELAPAGKSAITAELKAYGKYGDGSSFETGPFQVQVTACKGACTNLLPVCPDPTKPVYVGSCPQAQQTSVDLCIAATAP